LIIFAAFRLRKPQKVRAFAKMITVIIFDGTFREKAAARR
jgi:hypothetical protein